MNGGSDSVSGRGHRAWQLGCCSGSTLSLLLNYFAAENVLYCIVQAKCFAKDLELMKQGQPLKAGSKVYHLAPFLDEHG